MEINLKQLSENAIESTTGGKRMRLSENAQGMVFMLFTKNVYSNAIGTIVREITSNCFDSHVEAQVKSPVIIRKSYDKDNNQYHVSFIDFGVGMSPERIEDIYMVYFESTKRLDNTQIGGFGIGGKTPLAYKRYTGVGQGEYDNSFFVITIYNGIKYYYCIYEGADCPLVSLLHSESTTEHNGTEIRIPVLEKDMLSFEKEMVKQLYYFENVIFEGFENCNNSYETTLTNQYQIVRGKSFLFRGNDYSSNMHACLGRVAYPIDFNVLGLSSSDYCIPVAVRLEIGEVNVTVSREQLDYSEQTIRILKKKLADAKAEITALLAKQYESICTLEEYFNVKNEFGVLKFSNGEQVNVGNLIKQSDVDFSNFRYSFMKMPNDKQLFKFFFDAKAYGKKSSRSRYNNNDFEGSYKALKDRNNLLYTENGFERKILKQAYLKDLHSQYYIIEKRNVASNYIRSDIAELFNVSLDTTVDDNGKPVKFVQSLLEMQEEYMTIVRKHASDYDSLVVPEDFIQSRKNKRVLSAEMRNTTIPIKYFGHYSKQRTKLDNLFNYDMPIFYGIQEDESKLETAHSLFKALFDSKAVAYYDEYDNKFKTSYSKSYRCSNQPVEDKKNSILFIMVSSANAKYMKYCKNAYHVDQFFTRMLYRKENKVMSYFRTYDLTNAWSNLSSPYTLDKFSKVNAKWGKKIKEINAFINTLPEIDENIGYLKDKLSNFFNITNVQHTAEEQRIAQMIKEVHELHVKNRKYMNYIYSSSSLDNDIIVEILRKIMVF